MKMVKRIVSLMLALVMVLALAACGKGKTLGGESVDSEGNTVITFEFNSSVATSATITFRLASEEDGLVLRSSENLDVLVNGEAQYFQWSVEKSEMSEAKFFDFKLTVDLAEGANKIEFKILEKNGVLMDYVSVVASAELTWEPHEDNPYRRDNEV